MSAPRFYGIRPPGVGDEALPGRLLVLEGTDGVGRSTQIALLREWLEGRGYAVVHSGFIRSDLTSRGIMRAKRGNTLDPLTLNLFYATDFWDRLERNILPALRAGMIALVDRYVFTLIARAVLRGVEREWIEDVYGFALVPDKVLYLVRSRRERETLARQLKQTNDELQQRVRELTTIFAIGKAVTSITNQRDLFEKIVEGAVYVTEADCGSLLLREGHGKVFNLAAQRNLPKAIAEKINQPWDDGISSLVALSGETLSISGLNSVVN